MQREFSTRISAHGNGLFLRAPVPFCVHGQPWHSAYTGS